MIPTTLQGMTVNGNGEFEIGVTGMYMVTFWMSEVNDIGNTDLAIAMYKNNAGVYPALVGPVVGPVMRDRTKVNTEVNTLTIAGLIPFTAGDILGIAMAANASGNVTISDAGMSIILLEDMS